MGKEVFRVSTLDERRNFYNKEFSIKKLRDWFTKNNLRFPQLCALDAGTETKIIIDKKLKNNMYYFPFKELKKQIAKYIPEDIYYDRNLYLNPDKILNNLNFNERIAQELVFDVDSDNFKCGFHGDGKVCRNCLEKAFRSAVRLKSALRKKGFMKIEILYSGRGFHVHVLDNKAFYLTNEKRRRLSIKFSKYGIDEWVSNGDIHLIRMPYSLNSLVSKIVIPLKKNSIKDLFEKSNPKFLKLSST